MFLVSRLKGGKRYAICDSLIFSMPYVESIPKRYPHVTSKIENSVTFW